MARANQIALLTSVALVLVALWLHSYPWVWIFLAGAAGASFRVWRQRHTRVVTSGERTPPE